MREPEPKARPASWCDPLLVITPAHFCDPQLAIAAVRAGGVGLLDLGLSSSEDLCQASLKRLGRFAGASGQWGVCWDLFGQDARRPRALAGLGDGRWPFLLLAGVDFQQARLQQLLGECRELAARVLVEVYSPADARAAQDAGFDGLILKGNESGGRAGKHASLIFLQHVRGRLRVPYWVRGGISPYTAPAAVLAGACGVVLGEQVWLARESPLPPDQRTRWQRCDGSETVYLGDRRHGYRFFARSGRPTLKRLADLRERGLDWFGPLKQALLSPATSQEQPDAGGLIPLGEEIAFASGLAQEHVTVGGILSCFRAALEETLPKARRQRALAPEGPLARSHATRYPVVQGPMTRVSDLVPFCEAVAGAGGLPFLALALMRKEETERLLVEARARLGRRAWGVGVLAFLPTAALRDQLEVVRRVRPPFAVLAGGRPDQAAELQSCGIQAYVHVPSPRLLELFVRQGLRRVVLEGQECGGHVGPRSSFTLWGAAVDVLLAAKLEDPSQLHVLFAGGIHDCLSAAMVASIAAPLVERGMKVGVVVGTAYVGTTEAVATGALTAEFQRQALRCEETALLESGVGHASRCATTPFVEQFQSRRRELAAAGKSPGEIRLDLEMLSLGRLRLAAKGLKRTSDPGSGGGRGPLVCVSEQEQAEQGMFMLGEAATLMTRPQTIAELHEELCGRSQDLLEAAGRGPSERHGAGHCDEVDAARSSPRRSNSVRSDQMPNTARRPARRRANAALDAGGKEPLAVIGMACLFPECGDLGRYWQNVLAKFNAVREVPPDRWPADVFFSEDPLSADMCYSKWGAFLGEVVFDPVKYRIPPASVRSIEPIQLLALEVAQEALRDAGYLDRASEGHGRCPSDSRFPRDRTAVIFALSGPHDLGMAYGFRTMLRQYLADAAELPEATRHEVIRALDRRLPSWTEDSLPGFLNNVVAGRISNYLDLGGPNFVVDAACAASLAALHIAVEQLRAGICDMALVGAADATNSPAEFMSFAKTFALSPRGKPCPFDDSADGIVLGEGLGVIVLKRLTDAERDGDNVYAVLRGVGVASDGHHRSLTAPHPPGQVITLRRAYRDAGVSPGTVSLIEGHGTGTALGDRVEIEALREVVGDRRQAPRCALGSVKSMIGHAKAAAGIAGLIKTCLALKHKVLPPTNNVEVPNQQARLLDGPLYLNTQTRPWIHEHWAGPRRAGVSGFGFGGTNFHAVLEEYTGEYHPGMRTDLGARPAEVFVFTAADPEQLVSRLKQLHAELGTWKGHDVAQLAASAWYEAERHGAKGDRRRCRLAIVAADPEDLRNKLAMAAAEIPDGSTLEPSTGGAFSSSGWPSQGHFDVAAGHRGQPAVASPAMGRRLSGPSERPAGRSGGVYFSRLPPVSNRALCFLFPGQGAQRIDMLGDLLLLHPEGLSLFAEADRRLRPALERPLSSCIYPTAVFDDAARSRQEAELNDTRIAQPALGVVGLFALDLLRRFGLEPGMAAGHSYGETVALCAAGCLTRPALMDLSALRGELVHRAALAEPGGMAAVIADEPTTAAALQALDLPLALAGINAPNQTVIAGPRSALEPGLRKLAAQGLRVRRLPVTAAFHTPQLEATARQFAARIAELPVAPPTIPVYSNATAQPFPAEDRAIRQLIARQMVVRVRFDREIREIYEAGGRVFLEVGPGSTLTAFVDRILHGRLHTALALDAGGASIGGAHDASFRTGGVVPLAHLLGRCFALGLPVRMDQWFAGRRLAACTLAEFLRRDRLRHEPKPTDWVLSVGRAAKTRPAVSPPVPPPVPPQRDDRAEDDLPRSEPMPADAEPTRSTDSPGAPLDPPPGPPPEAPPKTSSAGSAGATGGALAQFQATMASWLDLQKQQQRANERFLDLQQQYLTHLTDGRIAGPGEPALPTSGTPALGRDIEAPVGWPGRESQPIAALPPLRVPPAPTESDAHPGEPSDGSSAEAPSAPRASADQGQILTAEQFREVLLEVVSRRTGYPEEMLEEDLLLEGDLGIDSIKRIEVFGELKDYCSFMLHKDRSDEEVLISFTSLRTLRDIVEAYGREREEYLRGCQEGTAPSAASEAKIPSAEELLLAVQARLGAAEPDSGASAVPAEVDRDAPADGRSPIERFLVRPVQTALPASPLRARLLPEGQSMLVLGQLPGADARGPSGSEDAPAPPAGNLAAELGSPICQVVPGPAARRVAEGRYQADFASPASVAELHDLLRRDGLRVGGLLNLLPFADPLTQEGPGEPEPILRLAAALLNVLKQFEKALRGSSAQDAGWLVSLTSMGGQFGIGSHQPVSAAQAIPLGILKTLHREWPGIRVKNIDLARDVDPRSLLPRVGAELRCGDESTEVGLTRDGRWTLRLDEAPLAPDQLWPLDLDQDSVILATGGARGITAEVVKWLAGAFGCRFVLIGRSAPPADEPPELRPLADRESLARHLIEQGAAGEDRPVPSEVENRVRRILSSRQIRANLRQIGDKAAAVEYLGVDVRDQEALAGTIETVYDKYGRIDGVIHGAGIVEDRRFADKSPSAVADVLRTKIIAARVLAEKLRPESLRFLVFFSSVAARFGNPGQADYSAANEYLNKLADHLHAVWPARVIAINWGPWDRGMVSPHLARLLSSLQVGLIPAQQGARACLAELEAPDRESAEVILGRDIRRIAEFQLGPAEFQRGSAE